MRMRRSIELSIELSQDYKIIQKIKKKLST